MIHHIALAIAVMSGFGAFANAIRFGVAKECLGWTLAHAICCGVNLSIATI